MVSSTTDIYKPDGSLSWHRTPMKLSCRSHLEPEQQLSPSQQSVLRCDGASCCKSKQALL